MRWVVLTTSLLLLLLGALAVRAGVERDPWIDELARVYQAQPVQERTLPNGMRVLVLPRGTTPWCAVATVLPGGAREDPAGLGGLAHLAEHLMFESEAGSDKKNTDVMAESLGMRSNAFTLADYTVLIEEFSPAVLERALGIHLLRLQAATFEEYHLVREKKVVADERRFRVSEPPLGRAEEMLLALVWQGHPYGRPVLGAPVEVGAIRSDDIRRWMRNRVRPERAVMALVGRVDPTRALQTAERVLGAWARGAADNGMAPPEPPAHPPTTTRDATMDSSVDAVMWAAAAAPLGSVDESADRMLSRLLEGDPYYRLANPPEDMPGIEVQAEYRAALHHGEMVATVTPHGDVDVVTAARALQSALTLFAEQGAATESVVAARTRVAADHQRELEIHASLAERLAVDRALLGRWQVEADRLRALAGLGPQDVRRRAAALKASPWQALVRARAPEAR
ncbi:MAG: pitrilysin family protein [Myxococcota bacterium]